MTGVILIQNSIAAESLPLSKMYLSPTIKSAIKTK